MLGGCDRRLSFGTLTARGTPRDSGALQDGSARLDGAAPDAGRADASHGDGAASLDTCDFKGPLLAVGDGVGPDCPGGAASRAFRYALCSCDDLINNTSITVDAFGNARQTDLLTDGSLGMNGAFYPVRATLGGSLVVAGTGGIPTRGPLALGGSLRDQGQLDGQFDIQVGGDMEVGADVRVKSLTLGGTLRVSTTSTVDVSDGNPTFTRASINIPPPCDCDGGPDIAALVAAASNDNDNSALRLDAAESFRSLNAAVELTLPCGRYYADAFYAPNPITLTITGRVALYVAGDLITEGGDVRVQLAPGAELDLLIAGNLSTGARVELGNSATRGRVRVYAGGTGSLSFAGDTLIVGSLYAPNAELVTSATFEVFGAVLARRVSSSGEVRLHYDRALADGVCASAP